MSDAASPPDEISTALDDPDSAPCEISVDHGTDQTVVSVEVRPHGSVAALIDVGHLPLDRQVTLARDIREAFEHATSLEGGAD